MDTRVTNFTYNKSTEDLEVWPILRIHLVGMMTNAQYEGVEIRIHIHRGHVHTTTWYSPRRRGNTTLIIQDM